MKRGLLRVVVTSASGALLLFAVACGQPPQNAVECRGAALVGGAEHGEFLALHAREEAAVCQIQLLDEAGLVAGVCSGALIDPLHVVSAGHCFDTVIPLVRARFVTAEGEASMVGVAALRRHETLDLAVVTLDEAVPEWIAAPLRVPAATLGARVGEAVQISGFGASSLDARRFAVSTIIETRASHFRVSASGRAAACAGDSGGPALIRVDGYTNVMGILSAGSRNCAGSDEYIRLDAAGDWLHSALGQKHVVELHADCQLLGPHGRCFGSVAVSCEQGLPLAQRCDEGETCGFSEKKGRFACVRPSADACGGVNQFGHCDGDVSVRCVAGELERQPCSACGATCVISAMSGKAICNAE